ncbi:Protein prenyltransferase alpha subunit [Trinorchestia longiramus]|nr:Protein prenyltransferase alpha subunit [Trinorchestia longiramus]
MVKAVLNYKYITITAIPGMESATCERIISQVFNLISKNNNLGDFDVVPSSGEENVSPVVLVEGNLGIASWCVKHVYAYAYHSCLQCKTKLWSYDECESLSRWTQFCLLIRPEVSTFWNIRRMLLKKGLISSKEELLLTRLILSRKPKCIEAFYERQWLYSKVIDVSNSEWVARERNLCSWASSRHQNNYHAWNHRLWLLSIILLYPERVDLLKTEFEDVIEWAKVHVSEHSCMHYVNKLVERIVLSAHEGKFSLNRVPPYQSTPLKVYESMLSWNKSLIVSYPGHETLFYARQSLLLLCRECLERTTSSSTGGEAASQTGADLDDTLGLKEKSDAGKSCCEQPALKRTCVENLSCEWTRLVMRERSFAEEFVQTTTNDFDKSVAQCYARTVSRFSI